MNSFIIEQKQSILTRSSYQVYEVGSAGLKGNLVAFTKQDPDAFEKTVTFYEDTDSKYVAFSLKSQKSNTSPRKFGVFDARNNLCGILEKTAESSPVQRIWHIYPPDSKSEAPLLIARERNADLALLRKIKNSAPVINKLPFLFQYHFDFLEVKTGLLMASYAKSSRVKDSYRLDIQEELQDQLDWRVIVASCLLMDVSRSW